MSELEKLISELTHKSYRSGDTETNKRKIKFGGLPEATSSARVPGPCGETMEIYLEIEGGNKSKMAPCLRTDAEQACSVGRSP
jgi:hypothetical protein